TVREDSGAASLLKKAPVRASPTAWSSAFTTALKLPVTVAGAPALRNTASGVPARSTTAITIVSRLIATAARCTALVTSAAVRQPNVVVVPHACAYAKWGPERNTAATVKHAARRRRSMAGALFRAGGS